MRYIIAGGGTAGHINPGIAIAKHIRKMEPDADILFIGTKKGLESELVPREGFHIRYIDASGFKRKISIDNMKTISNIFKGYSQSKKIVKEFKPDAVIGTGGYVCFPILYFSSKKKIPTIIHEQNAFPGLTNRVLSRFVDAVAISFKESEKYFKNKKNMFLKGNPVRKKLLSKIKKEAREKLMLDKDSNLILVFGGSLGAEKLNQAIIDIIKNKELDSNSRIIFATGKRNFELAKEKIGKLDKKNVEVVPYIYDMATAMAAADIVACRAGAITLSELTAVGIPSILIPSPYVTANHQEHNARALEAQGASVVILEKDLSGDILYQQLKTLLSNKVLLNKMSKESKKMGILDSVEKIYTKIKDLM